MDPDSRVRDTEALLLRRTSLLRGDGLTCSRGALGRTTERGVDASVESSSSDSSTTSVILLLAGCFGGAAAGAAACCPMNAKFPCSDKC